MGQGSGQGNILSISYNRERSGGSAPGVLSLYLFNNEENTENSLYHIVCTVMTEDNVFSLLCPACVAQGSS